MLTNLTKSLGVLIAGSAALWAGGVANAQTLSAVVTQAPAGPNSTVEVTVSYDHSTGTGGPATLHGFDFGVIYNNSEAVLTGAVDMDPIANTDPQRLSDNISLGSEQTNPELEFDDPALDDAPGNFNSFKALLGSLDEAPAGGDGWISGPVVKLTFQTTSNYNGNFDFLIRQFPSREMATGSDDTQLFEGDNLTVSVPASGSTYDSPVITDISHDGTWLTNQPTIQIDGYGFYEPGSGAPQTQVVFDGDVDATVDATVTDYNTLTVEVPQAIADALDQYAVSVTNGTGYVDSDDVAFYVVDRDTIYVDDSYTEAANKLVASSSPAAIIGANAFTSIQAAADVVNANGDIEVAAGSYTETVVVSTAGVTVNGTGNPNVTAPTSSSNAALFHIAADNLTVQGIDFLINRPYATAGVVQTADFLTPKVYGNTFSVSGSGGNADAFVGFGTETTAICINADTQIAIAGNIVGSAGAPFDRAIFTRTPHGVIGGDNAYDATAAASTKGNSVFGVRHDMCIQFVSRGLMTVKNNYLGGWGDDDSKGAQMDFTEPNGNGSILVENNVFEPQSGTAPILNQAHVRSLMIKNNKNCNSVTIQNNIFNLRNVGILSSNSIKSDIKNNIFTPVTGVSGTKAIVVTNKVSTSSAIAPATVNAEITGNTFNTNGSGGTAIAFQNHNSTPVPTNGLWGSLVVGGEVNGDDPANIFDAGLDNYIVLDPGVAIDSDMVGAGTPAPFAADIDATENIFAGVRGSAATVAQGFAIEDKISHALENSDLGLVRITAAQVYVTANSGSIQRGVDVAEVNDTVHVQDASYVELVNVATDGVKLVGDANPEVSAPASAENDAVILVAAPNVRIEGFDVVVNQPDAAVGIAATGSSNVNNVQIVNNVVTTTGAGAADAAFTAGNLPFGDVAGISVYNLSHLNDPEVTVTGNTVGTATNPFKTFGILLDATYGLVDNNTIYGEDFDLIFRFVSDSNVMTVTNNNFNGWGDDGNKGAQVEIGDPQACTIHFNNNTFTPRSTTSPNGKVNRRSLQVKNNYNTAAVLNIDNNVFNVVNTGLALTNAYNANVTNNDFFAAADDALLLEVNNKIYSSSDSHQNSNLNNATIKGNLFQATNNTVTHANVTALEFRDHTQTNAANSNPILFGSYLIGATGEENTFESDLAWFIRLDDSDGPTSDRPDIYGSIASVTEMDPFSDNIVAKSNRFDVGGDSAKLPSELDLTGLAALNAKIYDGRDDGTPAELGLVLLFERVHNTTQDTYFDYIQDAINDPATGNGDEIVAGAGWYPETNGAGVGLVVNKELTITGPNAGTHGNDSRADEAVIVPAEELNASGQREWSSTALVNITSAEVAFSGFTISGDNPSISGYEYAGMDVEAGRGVRTVANNVTISDNIVENFTYMGIHSAGGQVTPHFNGVVISGNKLQNIHDLNQLGYGFALYIGGTAGLIDNNVIENSRTGMQIQPYRVQSVSGVPTVSNNTVSVWRSGIYFNYSEVDASAWLVTDNDVSATAPPEALAGGAKVRWEGLVAETMHATGNGVTFDINTVDGSNALASGTHAGWGGFTQAVFGMRFANATAISDDVAFTNNVISNVQVGFVHESNAAVTLTGNSISSVDDTILLQLSQGSTGSYLTSGGQGTVDATGGNTYNGVASNGASLADLYTIEDNITHALDSEDLGLVRVVAQNLYVTEATLGIQRSVNLADAGDTVNVEAGDYAETYDASSALYIDKALSLEGPNVGKAGADAARNPEAVIRSAAVLGGVDAWQMVVYVASDNVTMSGFTVDCTNVDAGGVNFAGIENLVAGTGIYTEADNVTVSNNIVQNGTYIGIWSGGYFENHATYGSFDNVSFANNLVQNFHSNTIGYGIYFQGTMGSVNNNTIANVRKGIQVQPYDNTNPLNVTLEANGNIISAWHRGFYFNYANVNAPKWTFTGNNISAVAAPAVGITDKTVWEGVRIEAQHATAAGADFIGTIINGAVAMTDSIHDGWDDVANAVWGIVYVGTAGHDNIALTNSVISNVELGYVHSVADAHVNMTGNTIAAADQAISIQTNRDAFTGADLGNGGTGNVTLVSGNTLNTYDADAIALVNQFNIEDVINHAIDSDGLGFVRVVADQLYVTQDSASIANAVAVTNGPVFDADATVDTINVEGGANTYVGDGIEITQAVTIDGFDNVRSTDDSNAGAVGPVVMNPAVGTVNGGTHGFIVKADNVTIQDMSISGKNTSERYSSAVYRGIEALYNNTLLDNLEVKFAGHWGAPSGQPVTVGKQAGVLLAQPAATASSTGNSITDCDFFDIGYAGVRLSACEATVSDNSFHTMAYQGLYVTPEVAPSTFGATPKITATGNTFDASEVSIRVHAPTSDSVVSGNSITLGNRNKSDGGSGVLPELGVQVEWGACEVSGNTFTLAASPAGTDHIGVWLWNITPEAVEVSGNTFLNNGVANSTAIAVVGERVNNLAGSAGSNDAKVADAQISGNSITGYARGVALEYADTSARAVNATINGSNTFTNCTTAIELTGEYADAAIADNTFDTDNATQMYIVNNSPNDIDIKTNTFDSVSVAGLTIPDDLSSFWTIQAQLEDKMDDSANGYLSLADDNVFVPVAKESPDGDSKYILTRASDAAENGDTIWVQGGAYNSGIVDKLVAIKTDGTNEPVVSGQLILDIPTGTGTVSLEGFAFNNGNLVVDGTDQDSATFSVVDSSFTGTPAGVGTAAVSVANATNGTLDQIEVSGYQSLGTVLMNSTSITVEDSIFENLAGSAISVVKSDYLGSTPVTADAITIQRNTINNIGVVVTNGVPSSPMNAEAYGILVGSYQTGTTAIGAPFATDITISDNTVKNAAATGVFLSNLDVVDVTSNLVTDNTIDSNGWSGTVPGGTHNTDGLKINSSQNVSVTGNFIINNKRYGVLVRGEGADHGTNVVINSNHIYGNEAIDYNTEGTMIGAGLALQLYGDASNNVVDATDNWWGHVYGPYVAGLNEIGRGDAISDQGGEPLFQPWYGERSYAYRWKALNDRDGDGLLDAEEDPSLLAVGDNLNGVTFVDDTDSDGDGYEDGVEVEMGSDPFDGASTPVSITSPHAWSGYSQTSLTDTDGDGYLDFYEVAFGSDPADMNDTPSLGDANDSGAVDGAADLSLMRQVLVLNTSIYASHVHQDNMDLNRDGTVSNIDVIALRRYLSDKAVNKLPISVELPAQP